MKNNTPTIRFSEFDKTWNSVPFSMLYEKIIEKNDLTYGKNDIISVANMYFKPDSNITDDEYLKTYNVFHLGDIAFEGNKSKNYAHGRFVENTIGDGIVSHVFDVFRPITEYDLMFWKYLINNESVMRTILVRCTNASTMMTNLVASDFLQEHIHVPLVEEQKKIGSFLNNLDSLIDYHQKRLSKTKQIRLALMSRLFPVTDSDVPSIRFKQYTKSWNKYPLRSVITPYTDYLPTPTDGYTRLGIRSHMKGTFYEYVAPSKQLGEKRLQRVKRDNFIVNIVFAWEHAIAVTTEEDEGKLVSHRFPQFSFNEGMYPRFFHYALNDERFRHHLWLASPSGAGRNKTLRIDEMLEYGLRVPEYEEQKIIADFLTSLDSLIELYDYRITKLQNIKAACLQGMFVQEDAK